MLTTVLHGFWIKRTWIYPSPLLSSVTNICLFQQHFKYLKITMFLKMSFLSYDSYRCVSCKWVHIAPIYIQNFLQCISSKLKSTKMAGTSMTGFSISITTVEDKLIIKLAHFFSLNYFLSTSLLLHDPVIFTVKFPIHPFMSNSFMSFNLPFVHSKLF